jgi:hypothetical protein
MITCTVVIALKHKDQDDTIWKRKRPLCACYDLQMHCCMRQQEWHTCSWQNGHNNSNQQDIMLPLTGIRSNVPIQQTAHDDSRHGTTSIAPADLASVAAMNSSNKWLVPQQAYSIHFSRLSQGGPKVKKKPTSFRDHFSFNENTPTPQNNGFVPRRFRLYAECTVSCIIYPCVYYIYLEWLSQVHCTRILL